MHLLRFSNTFLSKLNCFALLFLLVTFSPTVMASDSDDDDDGIEINDSDKDEQGAEDIDLAAVIRDINPVQLKEHLIKYRDSAGRNYLHLIRLDQFNLFVDTVDNDVAVGTLLLEFVNRSNPFDRFVKESTINPSFIQIVTTPRSSENYTFLMAAAMRDEQIRDKLDTLTRKGVTIDQKDIYGNTAESIDADWAQNRLSYLMVANNPNMARYKSQSLSNALWQDILQDKYSLYMRRLFGSQSPILSPDDFAAIAFQTIYNQTPSSVHAAFLLVEKHSLGGQIDQDRTTANDLWRGFFKAYDTLLSTEDAKDAQRLPLSGRILSAVSQHQYLPKLHDATAQLISGSSRFGVKFKKATEEEAEAYVWGIRNYVQSFLPANCGQTFYYNALLLKDAFSIEPLKPVTPDKEPWLVRHQLKCTVVALYALNEFYDRYSTIQRAQKLDEEGLFSFIDTTLTDWPLETSINSRALFANVKSHLRADSEALDFEE